MLVSSEFSDNGLEGVDLGLLGCGGRYGRYASVDCGDAVVCFLREGGGACCERGKESRGGERRSNDTWRASFAAKLSVFNESRMLLILPLIDFTIAPCPTSNAGHKRGCIANLGHLRLYSVGKRQHLGDFLLKNSRFSSEFAQLALG